MAILRFHTTTVFDTTNPDWPKQAAALDTAIDGAIRKSVFWDVDEDPGYSVVFVGHVGGGQKTGIVRNQVNFGQHEFDEGDAGFKFETSANMALVLTDPDFPSVTINEFDFDEGETPALLTLEVALSTAISKEGGLLGPPGLNILPPGSPFADIELDFVLAHPGQSGFDLFNVVNKTDLPDTFTAQINWTATPFEVDDPLVDFFQIRNVFTGDKKLSASTPPIGLTAPLIGAWHMKATSVISDDSSPAITATIVQEVDTDGTTTITKDAVGKGTLTSVGILTDPTVLFVGTDVFKRTSPSASFFTAFNGVQDIPNGSRTRREFNEIPTIFRQFDSITNELIVTNDTGATIPAGTVLGQLRALISQVDEIF